MTEPDDRPYGQIIREKGIQMPPSATPTRTRRVDPNRRSRNNQWEKGLATDERGVPYLDEAGRQIPIKRYVEKYRHKADERVQRIAAHNISSDAQDR